MITQQEGLDLTDIRDKILKADIKGDHFDENWRGQSIWFRLMIYLFAPVYIAYFALFGTRQLIAEHIAMEDLESTDEILLSDKNTDRLQDILLKDREAIIVKYISDVLLQNAGEVKTVAIVYGAVHMRKIVYYLDEIQGFRITNSEWLTVFDL